MEKVKTDPNTVPDKKLEFEFGTGRAGETARLILSYNPPCSECKEEDAILTLDFDYNADLSQIPLCFQCVPIVKVIISKQMESVGRTPSFAINGKGRN